MIKLLLQTVGSYISPENHSPVPQQKKLHTKLPNGAVYTGKIINGKLQGHGTLTYENGERYQGQFNNGMKHGKGKYYYIRGQLYIGDWFENKKHGKGQYFYENGQRYCGQFRNNMKHGKGTFIESDGNEFQGTFFENKKHGEGEYFDAKKNKFFVQFYQHGKLVNQHEKLEQEKYNTHQLFLSQQSVGGSSKEELIESNKREMKSLVNNVYEDVISDKFEQSKEIYSLIPKAGDYPISLISKHTPQQDEGKFKTNVLLPINKKIHKWTVDDVAIWLEGLGLHQYIDIFFKESISGDILLLLTENDLKDIGVSVVGDRKWIIKEIEMLKLLFKKQIFQDYWGLKALNFQSIRLDDIDQLKRQPLTKDSENKQAKQDQQTSSSSSEQDEREKKRSQTELKQAEKKVQRKNHDKNIQKKVEEYLKKNGIKLNFLIPKDQIEIIKPIGQGGYGQVFLGRWLGQEVAVKRYMKKRGLRNRHIGHFIQEVQLINKLLHPSIVLYMGMCIYDNIYAMITQFLSNGSLFDYLHKQNGKLSQSKMFYIVKDIALGMTYLHGKNVLHCDLKSSNVLIDENWNVKLCDFGLSRIHSTSKKGQVRRVGTPHWMAPEILRGEKYEFESDVYSFGILIWEMLAGQIPYHKYSPAQIIGLVGRDEKHTIQRPNSENLTMIQLFQMCTVRNSKKRPSFAKIVQFLQKHEPFILGMLQ